ncbi:MFS transporter [Paraburkholderia madseniana]|uniref:MFS transporter n=1 Tax=Paraburkholderia madseniana TaxID=2599607 RepID=A0A6N6WLG1_9BURK|nr:MFS transporter [Paraburkholderia madseniana]
MAPALRSLNTRAVMAAVIGNALEWYDFTVFGFLTVVIAQLFFPAGNDYASMLLTTATFGVAFVMRPIGGIVLGLYADRAGRKAALSLVIALMTLGILLLAIAPPYSAIGIGAPLMIVLGRLLQGFSAGGEFGSSTALLIEAAPFSKRGFYGSWQMASQAAALLLGAVVGALITHGLSPEALNFVVTWLINTTGSPLAPTYYVMGGLALSIVAVACIPGKRHADLDARRKPA